MIGPRHAHAHAFKSGEPEAVCERTVRFRAKSQGDREGIKKNEMAMRVWRGWNESLAWGCWIAQIVTIQV